MIPSLRGFCLPTSLSNTLQNFLTVLVQLNLGDDDLRWVDADRNALTVGLFTDNSLNVDRPLQTIDTCDLPLTSLVRSPNNLYLVVFADGNSTDLHHGTFKLALSYHFIACIAGKRTLYFSRSSLLRGALMIVRRTLEGALKCALRDFLREEAIAITAWGQLFHTSH